MTDRLTIDSLENILRVGTIWGPSGELSLSKPINPYEGHALVRLLYDTMQREAEAVEEIGLIKGQRDRVVAELEKRETDLVQVMRQCREFLRFVTCASIHKWDSLEEAEKEIHSGPFWERKLVSCQQEAAKLYEPIERALEHYARE